MDAKQELEIKCREAWKNLRRATKYMARIHIKRLCSERNGVAMTKLIT